MLQFLRPVRSTALIAASIVLLRIAAEVVAVYFLSPAVTAVAHSIWGSGGRSHLGFFDWLFGSGAEGNRLRTVLLWMAASQGVLGIMIYLRMVWDCKLSMRAVYYIRGSIFDRLQHVDFTFHDKMTSGQLINRALCDMQSVRMFVNASILTTLDIFGTIAGYLVLLFLRSPWLMLAALSPVPLWCIMIYRYSKKAQLQYQAQQQSADQMMSAVMDNVGGVQVVRGFGTENAENAKFKLLSSELLKRLLGMVKLQARLTPMMRGITTGAHILLFVISAALIRQGSMQIGDLMILGVAMGTILSKLQQISQTSEIYQKGVVSAKRFFEVIDRPLVAPVQEGRNALEFKSGEIRFSGVTFGYADGKPVLRDINAVMPAGKVTALIGPTGAGKSTLAGLIGRFYDPQCGHILLDEQDLRSFRVKDLRRVIGYVFQETFLFSDTIRNNIRYGRMDVNEEMLIDAAKAAQAHEFIRSLPQGYDTRLGDGGVQLSGGQRQRIALARALVYAPKILVLDDATASLDARTESAVHIALEQRTAARTVLVIAHRLSSVAMADNFLLMNEGRIIEQGSREELAASHHDNYLYQIRQLSRSQQALTEQKLFHGGATECPAGLG